MGHPIPQSISAAFCSIDQWNRRPRIYFEEWDDPIITGIAWVSELIELAGGEDIYNDQSHNSLAKDRIISNPKDIIDLQPDIILVSWCGKKFKKDTITTRDGWNKINAVKNDNLFEINFKEVVIFHSIDLIPSISSCDGIFFEFFTAP